MAALAGAWCRSAVRAVVCLRSAVVAATFSGVVSAMALTSEAAAWAAASRPGSNRLARQPSSGLPQAAAADPTARGLCGVTAAAVTAMFAIPTVAVCGVVARAAAPRRRRRRTSPSSGASPRPPMGKPAANLRPDASGSKVELDGRLIEDDVADIVTAFSTSDEDRRQKRKAFRKKREEQEKELERDPGDIAMRNLLESDDPNFFKAPYIWIQAAHVLLLAYVIIIFIYGADVGEDNILVNFEGEQLKAIKTASSLLLAVNFVHALFVAYEEFSSSKEGDNRFQTALGWGLKAFVIGGVASWQRLGRIKRREDKRTKEETRLRRAKEMGIDLDLA